MSIDIGDRRYLAWLGTEMGYTALRADLGTLNGYREVSRHRRREVVKITLGTGNEAQTQLRAALTDRGLNHQTVEELPFDIELIGTGAAQSMFYGCSSLTTVPAMDTGQVTNMNGMFYLCGSLTHVPDLYTAQVTNTAWMFYNCSALTDGNVRLIGRNPNVATTGMINGSGLTREPFYDTNGNPI